MAAPPANDDFADAQVIGPALPIDVDGVADEATHEVDEPDHGGYGTAASSIWYQWQAPATQTVMVDTCASDSFPLVAIYTGAAVDALDPVADSGDDCQVSFDATMGENYRIAIETFGDGGATNLATTALVPPANDQFAAAQVVGPALPVSVIGSNVDATAEAGEPNDPYDDPGTTSVWYRWTPGSSQQVRIDVCDSDFDTTLGVFTGGTLPATEIAQNDDTAGCGIFDLGSAVTLNAVAGTPYSIAVSGLSGDQGDFTLKLATVVSTPTNPNPVIQAPPAGPSCKKGQKLKNGKCVKKKTKKKKKKKKKK